MGDYETRAFKHATSKRGWDGPNPVSAAPEQPRSRSKKDTKKWCKGVVGREHNWAWIYRDALPNTRFSRKGNLEEIVEAPIPTLEEEKKMNQWGLPRAQKICLTCMKHKGWGENAFDLRRQGITILKSLPQ